MMMCDGDGNVDDGDIHRSHGDATPETAPQTCHPLKIQFGNDFLHCGF